MDRLAREGVRFANAVSTTSWTLPAHASLFTGLLNQSHGVIQEERVLVDEHVTLAEVLRDAGYQTAGVYGAPYLHPTFGMDQGFDVYRSSSGGWGELGAGDFRNRMSQKRLGSRYEITGPRSVAAVDDWMDDIDERPFFLFLHLWDVHYDYIPPRRYVELFDPDYSGDLDASDLQRNPAVHPGMDARDLEHLIALYDGEIRFTDDTLDQILKLLDDAGRLENTIVAITADHGEEFFEHGAKLHRKSLFDEVLRVPLIVRWPGRLAPGRVIEDQVQLIDIFPTLLSMAGVPLPLPVQGRDLSPLLAGEALPPVQALSELEGHMTALRSNQYKLIQFGKRTIGYRLARDPAESKPLAPHENDRRRLTTLVAQAEAFRGRIGSRAMRPAREELAPEVRERLRRLGYIDEDAADARP